MTTCTHRLDDTGLTCTRDEHSDRGHTYESSTGSEVGDRHDSTSGGEH